MGGERLVQPEHKPLTITTNELSALLKQLQQSVIDDRKALISARIVPEAKKEGRRMTEDDSDGEYASDQEGESMEDSAVKEDAKRKIPATAFGPPPSRSSKAAGILSLVSPMDRGGGKGGDGPVVSRIEEEASQLLGVTAVLDQIEAIFIDLANTPNAEDIPPFSPLRESPRRSISIFATKKGEKKKLIERYKAQLQTVDAERKSVCERARKCGETGAVALGMLREGWATVQTTLESKKKEMQTAYGLLTRHEQEVSKLKGRVTVLKKQIEELKARPPTVVVKEVPVPAPAPQIKTEELAVVQVASSKIESKDGAAVSDARLEQMEMELDLAYGKIEALSLQQHTHQDRSAVVFHQLQEELADVKAQLVTKAKKYAQLKEHVRQLEEELEGAAGQNEAIKHQLDLRYAKLEDRLREAMREALENERTAKSALFKREQAEAEAQRLREQYDSLVGQFEAVRSQVELEKMEASGIVARYEKELEDVYGRLDAKDEYAGLLTGVKRDMDSEMGELWEKVETDEANRQKMETAFVALGNKYRNASARRIFNFAATQRKRMLREAFDILKEKEEEVEVK